MLSRTAGMTFDPAISATSIEAIWALWRARPGTILVPGHDVPMILDDGVPAPLAARAAGISGWFGETLDELMLFDIAGP
jgi:N-acyl homoserine lactone hydrolase